MRYGGRTQGTPNKTTKELRQRIEAITEGIFNELQIHELTNKEKIDLLTKLLPYITPKLQAHQIENNDIFKTIFINDKN